MEHQEKHQQQHQKINMIDDFKYVSILGRFAFGMLCFEQSLKSIGYPHGTVIDKAIDKAWEFTTHTNLFDWRVEMENFRPDFVLEEVQEADDEYEKNNPFFKELLEAYKKMPPFCVEIFTHTIWLGTDIIGSGSKSALDHTMRSLFYVIEVAIQNNVGLPSLDCVRHSSVNEEDGWGDTHPRSWWRSEW